MYKTTDICLASVLTLKGFPIKTVEFETSSRAWFCFDNNADRIINDYNSRKIRVEPNKFFITMRDVKTRFYDEKKRQQIINCYQ